MKRLPLLCASALSAQPLMSVGYFNGGGDVTAGPGGDIDKLDVRQITHLNYSFGLIYNDEKDETNAALKDPAHLHEIWLSPKVQADLQKLPALRKQNPDLKVLLSVGGWGARGFSGAAATAESRAVFIRSAQKIIQQYGLDGIDLDWEFPVNGAWGLVASQPADRDNFTALLKSLREAVGEQKAGDYRRRRQCREPEKLGGRQSGGPGAELHQPDDLRHGLRHAVLQLESV
ncbi:putative chitinase II [Klebsiella pneumoniae subsp. rhinoscleromatis]|nr:putative chitinase II [Klebsiella pneumoniae subsp. rhinoscleromatis]